MKKIYIYATYDVEFNDGEVRTYRASTRGELGEISLNTVFEQQAEKVGALERKIIKAQSEIISNENV